MATLSQTCAECRALVPASAMAQHVAWHAALTAAVGRTAANHPHGPVTAERSAGKK